MPNSSKIAFIFHGEAKSSPNDKTPLEYLSDDVQKMRKALEHNWTIVEKDEKKLKRSFFNNLHSYKDDKVKDVLFYFTGHGIDHEDNILDEYTLKLSDDETQNITTKELVAYLNDKLQPTTLTMILDTCYSGQAEIETGNNNNIQILTSSNYIQPSYESWGVEGGLFTHFFCRAIESACGTDETGKITLGDIAEDIRKPLQKQGQDIVSKSIDVGELSHLAIAYNKEVWEIKQVLKNKYPKVEDFKKAILSYLRENVLNFGKIVDADTYLKLFQKLLEEKECLYCLLKELNLHEKYVSRVKKVEEDCSEYKEKIAKKRSVTSIILVIRKSTNGRLNDCMITRHDEKSDGKYNISVRSLSNVDFTNRKNYEKAMNSLLSDRVNSENILELKLILPEELFEVDFCTLQIETVFGRKKKLKEVFQISKKILMRFNDYKTVGYFERWKKNQTKFNGLKTKSIEEHVFLVDEKGKVSLFGKKVTTGEMKDGKKQEYLAVHSFYPLVNENHIMDMVEYGVPIVMSATETEYEEFDIAWEKSTVSDMKLVLFNHMDYNKNRLFIHDNYDEVVSLQEAIEKEKKRS